jgi:hypothetical protein
MATKKTATKKSAAPQNLPGPIASLSEFPQPGGVLSFPEGANVEFRYRFSIPGSLIVRLATASALTTAPMHLIDQIVPPPNDVISRFLPPLQTGSYVMNWSFVPTDAVFETAAEIWISGVLSYRQVTTNQSRFPLPKGFMFLEVF